MVVDGSEVVAEFVAEAEDVDGFAEAVAEPVALVVVDGSEVVAEFVAEAEDVDGFAEAVAEPVALDVVILNVVVWASDVVEVSELLNEVWALDVSVLPDKVWLLVIPTVSVDVGRIGRVDVVVYRSKQSSHQNRLQQIFPLSQFPPHHTRYRLVQLGHRSILARCGRLKRATGVVDRCDHNRLVRDQDNVGERIEAIAVGLRVAGCFRISLIYTRRCDDEGDGKVGEGNVDSGSVAAIHVGVSLCGLRI